MEGYRILIVEDDEVIAGLIREKLDECGYEVICAEDLRHVAETVARIQPHLVLLDVMLPYYNGFYWCTAIRSFSKVPIIFVSSASDNMNIVIAMDMGGDDFIAKPFDMNVLIAKIRAVIRRTYTLQGQMNALECNGAVLNLSDATLVYSGQRIELTKNDFRILELLMERTGKVVARDEIMQKLWEDESFVDDNTLTVNITRLRRKLEDAGLKDFIKTKKGIGYVIEP